MVVAQLAFPNLLAKRVFWCRAFLVIAGLIPVAAKCHGVKRKVNSNPVVLQRILNVFDPHHRFSKPRVRLGSLPSCTEWHRIYINFSVAEIFHTLRRRRYDRLLEYQQALVAQRLLAMFVNEYCSSLTTGTSFVPSPSPLSTPTPSLHCFPPDQYPYRSFEASS